MKKLAIGLSLIILSGCALWQLLPTKNRIHIGFYNVENLFDTIDNPHTRDNEFTPSGKKAWTIERMNDKIAKLDQVMSQATPDGVPDLLGREHAQYAPPPRPRPATLVRTGNGWLL